MHNEPGGGGGQGHLLPRELWLWVGQGQLQQEHREGGDVLGGHVAVYSLVEQVEYQSVGKL